MVQGMCFFQANRYFNHEDTRPNFKHVLSCRVKISSLRCEYGIVKYVGSPTIALLMSKQSFHILAVDLCVVNHEDSGMIYRVPIP